MTHGYRFYRAQRPAAFFRNWKLQGSRGRCDAPSQNAGLYRSAASLDELSVPPNYGLHELKGDRSGTWAMTVTRNWRLTFKIDETGALVDMDLEDYHGA